MGDTVVAMFEKYLHLYYQNNLINSPGLRFTRLKRNFSLKMNPLIFIFPIFPLVTHCYEMRNISNKITFMKSQKYCISKIINESNFLGVNHLSRPL